MRTTLTIPAALLIATSAHAVPYDLGSTADRPFVQLKTEAGEMVCGTHLRRACDPETGNYVRHSWGPTWGDHQTQRVFVGGEPGGDDDGDGIANGHGRLALDMFRNGCRSEGDSPDSCTATCGRGIAVSVTECSITPIGDRSRRLPNDWHLSRDGEAVCEIEPETKAEFDAAGRGYEIAVTVGCLDL